MSGVWISSVLSNHDIGMKQGARTKFYGHDWNPASLEIPLEPDEVYDASKRHRRGFALQRSEFPEAIAVFDEKRFGKIKDLFTAGPFYAVKGELAKVLFRFDLGDGGLIPFPIYQSDLVTPVKGEFFLLNFGARKDSILPEQSVNVTKFSVVKATGLQRWEVKTDHEDGDVAVSATTLKGPDLWFDDAVYNKIFMSDRLAHAIIEIGMKDIFQLKRCRVLEGAA